MKTFEKELESLINRYCKENGSNTPDLILANYLLNCLEAFDVATNSRRDLHGHKELSVSNQEKKNETI